MQLSVFILAIIASVLNNSYAHPAGNGVGACNSLNSLGCNNGASPDLVLLNNDNAAGLGSRSLSGLGASGLRGFNSGNSQGSGLLSLNSAAGLGSRSLSRSGVGLGTSGLSAGLNSGHSLGSGLFLLDSAAGLGSQSLGGLGSRSGTGLGARLAGNRNAANGASFLILPSGTAAGSNYLSSQNGLLSRSLNGLNSAYGAANQELAVLTSDGNLISLGSRSANNNGASSLLVLNENNAQGLQALQGLGSRSLGSDISVSGLGSVLQGLSSSGLGYTSTGLGSRSVGLGSNTGPGTSQTVVILDDNTQGLQGLSASGLQSLGARSFGNNAATGGASQAYLVLSDDSTDGSAAARRSIAAGDVLVVVADSPKNAASLNGPGTGAQSLASSALGNSLLPGGGNPNSLGAGSRSLSSSAGLGLAGNNNGASAGANFQSDNEDD